MTPASASSSGVVIVSYARTAIGRFRGSLSSMSAPQLASHAIHGILRKTPVVQDLIQETYLGNVMSAGMGQSPCRQAVLGANLSKSIICTTINKVCASGMKSVMLASQIISQDEVNRPVLLAGGTESMSNVPHYITDFRKPNGPPLGNATIMDGILQDGLTDAYSQQHMGKIAEKCALDYNISREDQDQYAIESYQRANHAVKRGIFAQEIEPISIHTKKSSALVVDQDEEPHRFDAKKIRSLSPAFINENGTVTAGNASSLSDGAAMMILMSEKRALELDLKPLARIISFGDAEQDPNHFPTSPTLAIKAALKKAKMNLGDVQFHEINEAFAVVILANMKLLGYLQDYSHVNILGGAIALGHPLGMSGTRVIGTLYSALKQSDATIGCASICNGGGGASAIIIERLN